MSDKNLALKGFDDINKILAKYSIQLWADLGTLLGFVRDGALIPWEEDIDVGCFQQMEDFSNVVQLDLFSHGWLCVDKYKGLSIQDAKKTAKIDIKFYDVDAVSNSVSANFITYKHKKMMGFSDFLIWVFNLYPAYFKYETSLTPQKLQLIEGFVLFFIPNKIRQSILKIAWFLHNNVGINGYVVKTPQQYILPLQKMKIDKYQFLVPNMSIEYVKRMYGENWKKPMKIVNDTNNYPDGSSRYLVKRVMDKLPDSVREAQ